MKTLKLLTICMFAALCMSAQNVPPFTLDEVEVIPPRFTEAEDANNQTFLNQFLANNFIFSAQMGVFEEGTEVVEFVVNPSGKVSDFKIINSVSREIDKEIIRVLEKTDNMWLPGSNNGTRVAMTKEVSIAIRPGETNPVKLAKDFNRIATHYYTKGSKNLLIKQNARKAMHNYEMAVHYKPYDLSALTMLALCKLEMGDTESAAAYASRIKKLEGAETHHQNLTENIKNLDAFIDLQQLLASN